MMDGGGRDAEAAKALAEAANNYDQGLIQQQQQWQTMQQHKPILENTLAQANIGKTQEGDDLKKEIKRLRAALEFYAERAVFERANQFPGDNELICVSHIAKDALKKGWP